MGPFAVTLPPMALCISLLRAYTVTRLHILFMFSCHYVCLDLEHMHMH